MKVLVTGATGFVGSAVVKELLARGHAVRALVRAKSKLANLEKLAIEKVEGDVLDEPSVKRAVDGCDALVHTAGTVDYRPRSRELLYALNVRGVEIVLGAALAAGVKRAVQTSSVAAMGGTRTPEVRDETSASLAEASGIHYLISKYRGEQAARALAAKGLPVVMVRPVFVSGPGDIYWSSGTTLLALARRQFPVYVPGGVGVADVRDIARGHVDALERGRVGEAYILGGENVEMAELTRRVAQAAGVRAPMPVPYGVAITVATIGEKLAGLVGKDPPMPVDLVKSSALYTFTSSAKAEKELGYSIRPFADSLRDTLRFFIEQGRLKPNTPALRALSS
jgi:dihydroflavonol-4-reductase